ncbi:MAG TPA: hypothetical protein VGU46_08060 [Acidobacteriaceae bacterium]|nr:hypothetical protein [Acidobacteriaceae bacterium]
MKTLRALPLFIFVALISTSAAFSQPAAASTVAANKSSTLHITKSSTLWYFSDRSQTAVWGTIDGVKVELRGGDNPARGNKVWVLPPGDYPVRIKHEEKGDQGIAREYEVDVTPRKHQTFYLTGMEE